MVIGDENANWLGHGNPSTLADWRLLIGDL
jgi:hypothetical protein